MRPHGEIRTALLEAARSAPGNVRELACRAQVGFSAAKYTASRMLANDELVVLDAGRPATLAAPGCAAVPPRGETLAAALQRLHDIFCQQPTPQD